MDDDFIYTNNDLVEMIYLMKRRLAGTSTIEFLALEMFLKLKLTDEKRDAYKNIKEKITPIFKHFTENEIN